MSRCVFEVDDSEESGGATRQHDSTIAMMESIHFCSFIQQSLEVRVLQARNRNHEPAHLLPHVHHHVPLRCSFRLLPRPDLAVPHFFQSLHHVPEVVLVRVFGRT